MRWGRLHPAHAHAGAADLRTGRRVRRFLWRAQMPKYSFHVSAAGIALAMKDGIDWILDIDTIELALGRAC